MLDDTSEERCVSAEIARLERRGIAVARIEHGGIVREELTWGWGKASGLLVRTTWIAHLGGTSSGMSITFRQSLWTFEPSTDPRDAEGGKRRWALEVMPDSRETAHRLKRGEEEDASPVA